MTSMTSMWYMTSMTYMTYLTLLPNPPKSQHQKSYGIIDSKIFHILYTYIYLSLSHSLCSLCNALYVTHCKTPHSLLISPALTHAAPQNAQPVPSPDSCGKVHLRRWRPFASAPTELEQTKPTKRSEIHGPPFWSNGWHMVILSWNMLKSWNHQFQHQ